jgi:hypothetical protein
MGMGTPKIVRLVAIQRNIQEDEPILVVAPDTNNILWIDEFWLSFGEIGARNKNQPAAVQFVNLSTLPTGGAGNAGIRTLESGDGTAGGAIWTGLPTAGWTGAAIESANRGGWHTFNFAAGFHWSAKKAGKSIAVHDSLTGFCLMYRIPTAPGLRRIRAGCMIREIEAA